MNAESAGPSVSPANESCDDIRLGEPPIALLDDASESIPPAHLPEAHASRCTLCRLHARHGYRDRFSARPIYFDCTPCDPTPVP
jgi:hypothetical protein